MTHASFRRASSLLLTASLSCAASAMAQDAKGYFEKAQTTSDQCQQMQYVCKAAEMDGKKKEYRQACDSTRASLMASDRESLKKAHDAFDSGDPTKYKQASRYAGYVCKANPEQYSEAQQILKDIQKAQSPATTTAAASPAATPATVKADQSSALYSQAKNAFDAGNLDVARTAANQVTDAALRPLAADIIANIGRYQGAVSAAKQREGSGDLDGAIKQYRAALQINSHVPDGTAAHEQDLEGRLAHAAVPTPAANVAKNTPPPAPAAKPNTAQKPAPEDPAVTAARFLADAEHNKATGHLQDALKSYEAVLRLQPDNAAAAAGKGAVLATINSDPAEQAKTLAQAIRDFYATKFSDAEDELSSYLSSTNVKSRGAAHFYLAATRLSRSLLEKPANPKSVQTALSNPDVLKLFKQSSVEQYRPVARFVSPLIMQAWQGANAGQ